MPELPEVETTLRGIEPYLRDQRVDSLTVRNGALRWPVSEQVYQLKQIKVVDLLRRGKYIVCCFESGSLLIHLGMSGNLRVVDSSTPIKKHDHIDLNLQTGKVIRFNDPRRFGCVLWTEDWKAHDLIRSLGLEPLSDEFDGDYLYHRAKGRKTAIKQFIMDSHLVVGVGNIYANEALFQAGIDPRRMAGRISRLRMHKLAIHIKQVLKKAIEQGGTTLKDFVGSDGKPGYFKQSLFVYGRAGKPCLSCGQSLKEVRQSNRSTVYCAFCQT